MLTVGHVSLAAVPSLSALLELDELSFNEFGQSLQAGDLFDMVFIRPQYELNSSSLLDEAVMEDTKTTLSACSVSLILIDPLDPFYPLAKEFQLNDVVCHDPPSVLSPDRGVRPEIDFVPETKYCVHGSGPYQRNSVTSLMTSSVPSTRPLWCVRVNIRTRH